MIPDDPERVARAARTWVQALWCGNHDQAVALLSPAFDRHNGGDAAQYLKHEHQHYQEHAPFAGWDRGWDVRVDWLTTMGCWAVHVLDETGQPTTRFWWWWDEQGVTSNGWPFQMIPKLAWGPWGVRRKITHDAHGWKLLPVGACQDLQNEQHVHDDGFSAVSWSWEEDQGDTASVWVHAQQGACRFKTKLSMPGRQEHGYLDGLFPHVNGREVWVPPQSKAFALDVRTRAGHAHRMHPSAGWSTFDAPVLEATLTDRLDHDWTTVIPANWVFG